MFLRRQNSQRDLAGRPLSQDVSEPLRLITDRGDRVESFTWQQTEQLCGGDVYGDSDFIKRVLTLAYQRLLRE